MGGRQLSTLAHWLSAGAVEMQWHPPTRSNNRWHASRVFRPSVMVLGGGCCCSAEGTVAAAAALVQGPRSRWSARHRGAGWGGLGVRGACVDMIKVDCKHYQELCDEDINMDGSGPGIDCPESRAWWCCADATWILRFLFSCKDRPPSLDGSQGPGGFVSCSPAVVYVTIRQFHQEKRTKGRRQWAVSLRSEAFVGPGG